MFGETDPGKLAELRKMPEKDQWQRMNDVRLNKAGLSQIVKDSLGNLQDCIDSSNMHKILAIIDTYGFPTYVEPWEVTTFFWHLPELLSDNHIDMLRALAKKKKLSGEDFAMIYDRRQAGRGLPELYYIQPHFDTVTRKNIYPAPPDLEATNKARAEIGLKKHPVSLSK